jgi:HPt (histidine-containing phosphotransfer) domain-containing protein
MVVITIVSAIIDPYLTGVGRYLAPNIQLWMVAGNLILVSTIVYLVSANSVLNQLKLNKKLSDTNTEIRGILENIPQGIMMVGPNGQVHPNYSAHLCKLLKTENIAGRDLIELLFDNSNLGSDTQASQKVAIDVCLGADEFQYELNKEVFIREFEKEIEGEKVIFEMDWNPIIIDDEIDHMLIALRDVTHLRALQYKAKEARKELETIGEIINVSKEEFRTFIESSRQMIGENQSLIQQSGDQKLNQEDRDALFRNMHTIKGNARTMSFLPITHIVHDIEEVYSQYDQLPTERVSSKRMLEDLERLVVEIERYTNLSEIKLGYKIDDKDDPSHEYYQVSHSIIHKYIESLECLKIQDAVKLDNTINDVTNFIKNINCIKLEQLVSINIKNLAKLSKELGKANPVVSVNDNDIYVKPVVNALLKNILTHMFRNTIDHGLETPNTRKEKGKNEYGTIDIKLEQQGEWVNLAYQDDGQGLNLDRIKAKAIEKDLIAAEVNLSNQEIAELIFHPGFSISEEVTDISGRGVGMDAIRKNIEDAKGQVTLNLINPTESAEPGRFVLNIKLPIQDFVLLPE